MIVALASCVAVLPVPPVKEERRLSMREAIGELTSWQTLYAEWSGAVVRADASVPVVVMDHPSWRIRWDGKTHRLTHTRGGRSETLTELPSEWEERFAEVWEEVRGGFPNTTFTAYPYQEVPEGTTKDLEVNVDWYEVEFPFSWDDDILVLAEVTKAGRFGTWVVLSPDGTPYEFRKRWSTLNLFIGTRLADVPLRPDYDTPALPEHRYVLDKGRSGSDGYPIPYHREIRQQRLEHDFGASTGRDQDGTPQKGLRLAHIRCSEAPSVQTLSGNLVWRFPDDPVLEQRAQDALAQCPEVRFDLAAVAYHLTAPGQTTCTEGTLTVRNTVPEPDALLHQQPFSHCFTGPHEEELAMPLHWTLPPNGSPTGLEVALEGTVTVDCGQTSQYFNSAVIAMQHDDEPILTWDCYPDWPPR